MHVARLVPALEPTRTLTDGANVVHLALHQALTDERYDSETSCRHIPLRVPRNGSFTAQAARKATMAHSLVEKVTSTAARRRCPRQSHPPALYWAGNMRGDEDDLQLQFGENVQRAVGGQEHR